MSRLIATIDLGSNSFHMLISNLENDGTITTISKKKRSVQLRAGLTDDLYIDDATQKRAIDCLKYFAHEISKYEIDHIEAVATYTLRKAEHNIKEFMKKLDQALGVDIKIISGEEEARLVYIGARQNSLDKKTLVIDIGGGSTEFVIGKGGNILISESLDIGCVGIQKDFFNEGALNIGNFNRAIEHIEKIILPIVDEYKSVGWEIVLGSSGTIQSVINVNIKKSNKYFVDSNFLEYFILELINYKNIDNVAFNGLREDKINVVAGGVAILYSIFDLFEIDKMIRSHGAVREGVIFEVVQKLLGSEYK